MHNPCIGWKNAAALRIGQFALTWPVCCVSVYKCPSVCRVSRQPMVASRSNGKRPTRDRRRRCACVSQSIRSFVVRLSIQPDSASCCKVNSISLCYEDGSSSKKRALSNLFGFIKLEIAASLSISLPHLSACCLLPPLPLPFCCFKTEEKQRQFNKMARNCKFFKNYYGLRKRQGEV